MSPEPRAVKPPSQSTGWTADQVKQYLDERISELQRAVDVAREGEPPHVPLQHYIEAIMDEQRRGLSVAEQEREKAARALRIELDRAIQEGDRALRDHVKNQIDQMQAALVSADLLEQQRIESTDVKVEGVRREVDKAEAALREMFDEKFKSVGTQFRLNQTALDAALQTQKEAAAARDESNQKAIDKSEQSTTETINKLSELVKSNIDSLSDKIDALTTRMDRLA